MIIPLPNIAATETFAQRLAMHLHRGDVVALEGPLGAGKTTFARAILRALGIKDEVPSPTFTLIQSYETEDFPVHHFDLYRLKSSDELDELGWDDVRTDSVTLVEWPERAAQRMQPNRLTVHFKMNDYGTRTCTLEPHGNWALRIKNFAA